MKTKKLIPLILTAALALSACTPAAETATAAEPATTPVMARKRLCIPRSKL